MIWNSILAMTVIDLLVVGAIGYLAVSFWRQRAGLGQAAASPAALLTLTGLAIVALFHLADLISMHVLPIWAGADAAQTAMMALHLETRWVVTPLSVFLIGLGLLEFQRHVRAAMDLAAANEARYRSIVNDQNDLIVRWQPGGIRTWANEPYCRTFGLAEAAVAGTGFFGLIDAADRARFEREIGALTEASPERSGVHRVTLPDGRSAWQEWTDRAVFDAAGRFLEYQSVGRDVTVRHQAEAALADSEARFRGVVESTADWVWEVDGDGRHVYSNDRLRDLLGYLPSELDGMHWSDLMHPDDLPGIHARYEEFERDGQGWQRWLVRILHRDGGYRYFESSATPMRASDGRIAGYRGIDRDATLFALLQRISSRLVGCPTAEVDSRIKAALEDIGVAYGLDRVSFWWLDLGYAVRGNEWALDGMEGPQSAMPHQETVPWMTAELEAQRIVKLQSLDELPAGSPDRLFLEAQGVRSTMVIPLLIENRMVGVAVFSTVTRTRNFSDAIVSDLGQLTEKIVAAYAQAEGTRRLVRSEHDLNQSQSLARVGSYAYYPLRPNARFPDEWRAQFSQEQCALLELDPDKADFDTFMARVHPEDRQLLRDSAYRLLTGETEVRVQLRAVTPSGRLLHLASRTQIDRDARGNNLRIIGASRDITDQLEREESLKAALEEVAKLRDRLEDENLRLRDEVRAIKGFEQIVGDSEPLRRCLDTVSRAAPTGASILLLGETGTGKELIAKAIHELSDRRDRRMVSLNCTALPAELVESELFGHERGAFTGAHRQRQGRFELADGGTLFLDEIGDLPVNLQAKLLRAIQDGSFERVGGTETMHVDVRIIAATNRDLQTAVAEGRFRADLYYRINTITIQLPTLRQRKDDIPLLAQYFFEKHGPRLNPGVRSISSGMHRYLLEQDWPGNVRELESFIERCLITADGKALTQTQDLSLLYGLPPAAGKGDRSSDLASVEREHIRRVLAASNWVIGGSGGAAARLGLPASTLRSRMKKLGIERAS